VGTPEAIGDPDRTVPGGFGATGVWHGEALANVLMALAVAGYFWRGRWDGRAIDDAVVSA